MVLGNNFTGVHVDMAIAVCNNAISVCRKCGNGEKGNDEREQQECRQYTTRARGSFVHASTSIIEILFWAGRCMHYVIIYFFQKNLPRKSNVITESEKQTL